MPRLGTLILLLGALIVAPAHAQQARIVALVVSVGDGDGRADAVQGGFAALGAETLRADDPNNAEMRSVLMRFADVAENRAVALIYIDAPVARFGSREFVLPAGIAMAQANDLLTEALPLSAFARAAALAEEGGAVVVAANVLADNLPDGVEPAETAPEGRIGMAPVVFTTRQSTRETVQALARLDRDQAVELGALIAGLTDRPGTSVSSMPETAVSLTAPAETADAPDDAREAEAADARMALAQGAGLQDDAQAADMSPEALAALERALSRAAKRRIQSALSAEGHHSGLIDGIIGKQTRSAIRAYQQSIGAEVTGYLTHRQILDLQQR